MRKHPNLPAFSFLPLASLRRLHPLAVSAVLLLAAAPGCRGDARVTTTPGAVVVPEAFEDFSDFYEGLNAYAQLRVADPHHRKLDPLRDRLRDWALAYTDERLDENEIEAAQRAMEVTVNLWSPEQLRQKARDEGLAQRARRLYGLSAAEGHEASATFALAAVYQFGDDEGRAYADDQYTQLVTWIEKAGQYASQPGMYLDLETVLQESLAVFPSPWMLERLSEHLMERYAGARRAGSAAFGIKQQAEYTGYILARAHLRADDPAAAVDALTSVGGNAETQALGDLLRAHLKSPKDPAPLRALITYFEPSGEAPLPGWVEIQSWAIVEHLAGRLLRIAPKDATGHLAMGRAFGAQGLEGAAIGHYERAVEAQPEVFAAWPELASLYQTRLESLASSDPNRARGLLPALESFHREAAKRWRDRPVEPGLPRAYMTVAVSLYGEGEPDKALALAEASLAIEPTPAALDLVGTIAHKRGDLALAQSAYDRIFELGFDSAAERVNWEIAAHLELASIATEQRDAVAGRRHLKAALRHLNGVLAYPQLDPGERGERHLERGRALFALGQVDDALVDFRSAASVAPERPSTFVQPIMMLSTHGYYGPALEIYGRAMIEDAVSQDLKLYLSLWILELGQRVQGDQDPRAKKFVDSFVGEGWVDALAQHARGQLDYEALLARAGDKGERAEAHYYEAMKRAREGGLASAKSLLSAVLDTGMVSFYEFEMARRFLAWEDIPRTARLPVTRESGPGGIQGGNETAQPTTDNAVAEPEGS